MPFHDPVSESQLQDFLSANSVVFTSLTSRLHPLPSLTDFASTVWVKRDDELGGIFGGNKLRKYASIIPFLKKNGIDTVVLRGSPYSNHLPAAVQLLGQNGMNVYAVLQGSQELPLKGNLFALSLLLSDKNCFYVKTPQQAISLQQSLKKDLERQGKRVLAMQEGANHGFALPGTLTLGLDLLHQARRLDLTFDHIFIDAGTGLSAIGLILGLGFLNCTNVCIHVASVAVTYEEFWSFLRAYQVFFAQSLRLKFQFPLPTIRFYPPVQPFGRVQASDVALVKSVAQTHHLLIDPIYGVRLWKAYQSCALAQRRGNALLILGGGLGSLLGYSDAFV